jgi:hypothetical protein
MQSFAMGINLPWVACGHDFGPRPAPWQGSPRTDWTALEGRFRELAEDGVEVLRHWVLAGGVNVPFGRPARALVIPWVGPRRRRGESAWSIARRRPGPERLWFLEAVPTWPEEALDDLCAFAATARRAGLTLWPSFLSFEWFLPLQRQRGGVQSRGRAGLAFAPRFFDRLLEPMLDRLPADAVAAVELINEPDWPVRRNALPSLYPHPAFVEPTRMSRWLIEGVERIVARGFVASVGFAHGAAPWLTAEARAHLTRLAEEGRYVHQAHHYPRPGWRLPEAAESAIQPVVLGEMASAQSDRWSDPGLREDDPSAYLEARLSLARARGYAGAFPWSVRAGDRHSAYSNAVRAQLRRFTRDLSTPKGCLHKDTPDVVSPGRRASSTPESRD